MAVGFPTKVNYATGDVLTATNMNDLSGTVNLLESAQYAAGKNEIINGDMGIWQRGTSFTVATSGSAYAADRMLCVNESGANATFSQQTFTPGTAPVSGYEGQFFLRAVTTGTSGATYITQRIEDVRAFAGQTVTVSYWAKCASGTVSSAGFYLQNFGSGGSSAVFATLSTATITTSWQRFTHTIAIPSIASKTIGTSSYLEFQILRYTAAATVDLWGVQVEAGSTASPFQTATGTKQGELAACQRYYNRYTPGTSAYGMLSSAGVATSTTLVRATFALPVEMRTVPSAVDYSTLRFLDSASGTGTISAANLLSSENSPKVAFVEFTSTGLSANRPTFIQTNNSTSGYVGFTAEL
ncbi:hypothetical protein UFOVP719_16 [uncultured Caudovirales phage]|uniref:CBM-cenC domain-containing protein n=1 Tax=uncultured Caudovirales phage TaxID=2100421 RepID=A0A6J5NQW4_9CAUD|nr:hypothetical protein UFOVP719_16 [uncultured Caudovirales phage]